METESALDIDKDSDRVYDGPKAERQELLRVFKETYEHERLLTVMSIPLEDSSPDTHPDKKKGSTFVVSLSGKTL